MHTENTGRRGGRDFLILFVTALAGYVQIALWLYSLKFDIIDQYLPWRQFAAECLSQGLIPFWNPYQHFGYAFSADPQSGAWYPFVWIAGLAGGYSVFLCQLEFFIHILLAGTGMYLLAGYLTGCRQSALMAGMVYMLSGFFIGNAQHLTYIISGAWFPFVIYTYLRMGNIMRLKQAVAFAVSLFFFASGGYPAFTIICSYILLILFLIRLVDRIRQPVKQLMPFLTVHSVALLFVVLLCSFLFVSVFQNLNYIAKSHALPLRVALFNPFSPQSLLSLFWPLVTTTDYSFFNTDMSMANLHFGSVFLIAFLFSVFTVRNRIQAALIAGGLFFLLASFGEYTPVRKWLYDYVPMMNLFRFPSVFRLFALFCFVLSAALYVSRMLTDEQKSNRFASLLFVLIPVICVSGIVFSVFNKASLNTGVLFSQGWYAFIHQCGFYDALLLQSAAGLIPPAIAFSLLKIFRFQPPKWLTIMVLSEMLIAAQIAAPKTVYSEFKTSGIHQTLSVLPAGFPVAENRPARSYSDSSGFQSPFWRNLSLLRKEPGFDGYNSFRMICYDSLADNGPLLRRIIENPTAFVSGSFSFYSNPLILPDTLSNGFTHLFFPDSLRGLIPDVSPDTASSVRYLAYSPSSVLIESVQSKPQLLTLMQHYHPMWKVTVNGADTRYYISNYLMMSVMVPAGISRVQFTISNPVGKAAFVISAAVLLLSAVILLKRGRN